MENFFQDWFLDFNQGLDKMHEEECGKLFSGCAKRCAQNALKYLYRDLFLDCQCDLDTFFSRLHEVENVDGKVIEKGKVFDIIFKSCNCPLHTMANVNTVKLCECSKQSIICELKELIPEGIFEVQIMETVLAGNGRCRFRISKM